MSSTLQAKAEMHTRAPYACHAMKLREGHVAVRVVALEGPAEAFGGF